jgi:hypothetical protein
VSPAVLFQLEREDADDRAIRKRIEALLQDCSGLQLRQVYAVVKALVEP